MPSLGKSGKTWRKGKVHPRGLPASLVLGRERSWAPVPGAAVPGPAGLCSWVGEGAGLELLCPAFLGAIESSAGGWRGLGFRLRQQENKKPCREGTQRADLRPDVLRT